MVIVYEQMKIIKKQVSLLSALRTLLCFLKIFLFHYNVQSPNYLQFYLINKHVFEYKNIYLENKNYGLKQLYLLCFWCYRVWNYLRFIRV